MAYEPKGYTDKDSVEKYMLIDIDDQFDEKLDEWICAVENMIDQETNRDWSPGDGTDEDRVFDGDGTDTLDIGSAEEVTSVKLSPDGDAVDTDQYFLYPANATIVKQIKLQYLTFPVGLQNIVVNAKWGSGDVPADIKHAATVLVAGIINDSYDDSSEVQSITVGRYSVSYRTPEQKNDLQTVQDILDRNKRYTF